MIQEGRKLTHDLKILPEYFSAVREGLKTFEIRKNDRDYQVGDTVELLEYDRDHYTGDSLLCEITYITNYEQKEGYVVFSINVMF
ncbi:DUF3850 domain-containing protein [Neobacillus sp. MM2021_6]|uniref:ASCH/PUA domain-containing protein n=1 Tax=Bacillaceae TaxID=186817 RepID=UPI00140D842D|nr:MULTISPECIES: ASCH/PUA domain-containing protein [Bacillaceae]MBO0962511.1 DUF3850 domain-containing protein [Neobacillus sp. MM2021_6]NHC21012.1 DUF3850 domain-containing protein [Bacillus sp. MM2020_4]